jgi:DNA-binding NarL/FixJ family response regulator
VRVLIIDDHVLFAEAMRPTLDGLGMTVVAVATTGAEGLELARVHRPDLILIDIGLPDGSGLVAGRQILEEYPEAKVVALTALLSPATVGEAVRIGFHGYLTKDTPVSRFASSLHAVADGHVVFPRRLASAMGRSRDDDGSELLAAQLTAREREVLGLMAEGLGGPDIARKLGITTNTVRTHIQSILTKLQVHSRLQAVAFALRRGVVRVQHREESESA